MTFFFLVSSNLKGIICTPKLCSKKKYRSSCSFKSYRPLYLFTWPIYWKNSAVFPVCALIRLITWFLSAVRDLPVQNWGITFSERKYWCKENVPCKNVEIFEMKFWLGKGEYSHMTHGINMTHGIKNMWTERMYFNPCWVVSIAYITRWLLRNWC